MTMRRFSFYFTSILHKDNRPDTWGQPGAGTSQTTSWWMSMRPSTTNQWGTRCRISENQPGSSVLVQIITFRFYYHYTDIKSSHKKCTSIHHALPSKNTQIKQILLYQEMAFNTKIKKKIPKKLHKNLYTKILFKAIMLNYRQKK